MSLTLYRSSRSSAGAYNQYHAALSLTFCSRAAIQSYPNGSAAGPDRLRPQRLNNRLIGVTDDSQFQVAVTDRTNRLLEGKTPSFVRFIYYPLNL